MVTCAMPHSATGKSSSLNSRKVASHTSAIEGVIYFVTPPANCRSLGLSEICTNTCATPASADETSAGVVMGAGGDGAGLTSSNGAPDAFANGTANGIANVLAKTLRSHKLSDKAFSTMDLPADAADNWDLHEPVTDIDKRDAGTPDSWVPRHPQLMRLTGRYALLLPSCCFVVPENSAPAPRGGATYILARPHAAI